MAAARGTDPDRPGAGQWVPDTTSIDTLREAVQSCRGCELHADAIQAVMGTGSKRARVVLLGEQPGDREDQEGRPFVGPAGRLLDKALDEAGVDPSEVFRTNVVKHFRFSGTRGKQRIHKSPSRVHVAACEPWLLAELDIVRPRGAVLLGATAGKALYGSGFRVGDARGQLNDWPDAYADASRNHVPEWVVATVHPAAVLRSRQREEDYRAFVADLVVVRDALAG